MPPKAAPLEISKKKKTSASSDGRKRRQTAAVKMDEQLHPADLKRRKRVMEVTRERYEQEVKDAFKHLDQLCHQEGSKRIPSIKVKKEALATWCQTYTNNNFPNIGKVAYAVPHFFIGKHSLKPDKDGLFFQHRQESDVRGDNAQSKVGRGLRLLSEDMEKNGENTMFTIGNILYEQVLIWPHVTSEACPLQKELQKQYPHLFDDKGRYFTRTEARGGRGEPDIVILHETKGVIIIQVKAFGTHGDAEGTNTKTKAVTQLKIDEEVFYNLFQHDDDLKKLKVCKVFALPNLTEEEAIRQCNISEKDGVHLLCKNNLFGDEMENAEAEYNLQKMKDWWEKLPDNPITLESIKDIVARFIGTFSKPRDLDGTTERTHVRTIADAVQLAGSMFKTRGLNLPEEQRKAVTSTEDEYKRTHVQGPPGSGRTTMLIFKAMRFLRKGAGGAASRLSNVVVLDMYRGLKGRPIGIHIRNAIRDADKETFDGRVHHLPIDVLVNQESFVLQVKDLLAGHNPELKDVLFIIDEMLPLSYWPDIFEAFKNEFKDSHVWCADGLIAQELADAPKFKLLKLEHIYRLPGSVQKVLYHADWDDKRKQQYCSDLGEKQGVKPSARPTQQAVQPKKIRASEAGKSGKKQPRESSADTTQGLSVCTHGPTAVCIKHQHHASNKALLDCVQCAEELKDLLMKKMKLVENETHSSPKKATLGKKAQAATVQAKADEGHGQAASTDMEVDEEDNPGAVAGPSVFLPCSIVIVFSIPSNLYQASDHVEINKEDFEYYVAKLNNSQFISTLRKALPVELFPGTTGPEQEQNQDPDCHDNWDKILLSWVDIFQGLERDVVVFLPGETAFQTEESAGSSVHVPELSTMNINDPPSPRRERRSPKKLAASPATSPRSMSPVTRSHDLPQPSTSTETKLTERKPVKRPAAAPSIPKRRIPEPGLARRESQQPISSRTRGAVGTLPSDTKTAVASEKGMSGCYWRVEDVQRYTDWDKTSLMFAATRCTSQLIMLVP